MIKEMPRELENKLDKLTADFYEEQKWVDLAEKTQKSIFSSQ